MLQQFFSSQKNNMHRWIFFTLYGIEIVLKKQQQTNNTSRYNHINTFNSLPLVLKMNVVSS